MRQRFQDDVLSLLAAQRGHFLLESGHHGDLRLNLELLCLHPDLIQPLSAELAKRLSQFDIDVVCGPLVEGAFIGLLVAAELRHRFSYSERFARPSGDGLFPAGYRLPDSLRHAVQKKRVAIVNDVINAGSAMRGTFEDLESCGANVVAIGALLTLGAAAEEFAARKNVPLESLANLPNPLWSPATCPLCASGVPLQDVAGFRNAFAPSQAIRSIVPSP
jgi:orotate phosphoribosyltransferase